MFYIVCFEWMPIFIVYILANVASRSSETLHKKEGLTIHYTAEPYIERDYI